MVDVYRQLARYAMCAAWICISAHGLDFSACKAYYKQASTVIDSVRVFSVLYNNTPHLIAFSKTPLHSARITKRDTFVGLYLFSGALERSYRLKPLDTFAHTLPLAAINGTKAIAGSVMNFEKGIFDLGKFSASLPDNAVISTICYQSYGIGAYGEYFVPKILIDRFLSSHGGRYGDIGVRVIPNLQDTQDAYPKGVIVEQIDAFFPKRAFLPQDRILSINGSDISSPTEFEWIVADLPPDSHANIAFLRKNVYHNVAVRVGRRYGGGLVPDTFLERYGVILDAKFVIQDIKKPLPFALSQLSIGDRLLWIDRVPISRNDNFWHFRQLLSRASVRGEVEFMVLHEGVEIFVHSKLP